MKKGNAKRYSKEFKEQVIKECIETNNYTVVAKKNNVPPTTVFTWIKRDKNKEKIKNHTNKKTLEKKLTDLQLENSILKELLKKTHQLWLKD